LITGHVLNEQGEVIKIIPTVWNSYKTSPHGPFSVNLDNYITQEQNNIYKMLSKIKFGDFKLNIMDTDLLPMGAYIYSCAQTLSDGAGKPMIDYLVCTTVPATTDGTLQIGLPPTSSNAQALLSLVTGNLYLKNTPIVGLSIPKPTDTYNVFKEFGQYFKTQNVNIKDSATIKAAQIAYLGQQQAAAAKSTSQAPVIKPLAIAQIGSIQSINSGQISMTQLMLKSTQPTSVAFSFHPSQSLEQRQRQAAGPVMFQFHAPTRSKLAKADIVNS
jgi:hypothetical protein